MHLPVPQDSQHHICELVHSNITPRSTPLEHSSQRVGLCTQHCTELEHNIGENTHIREAGKGIEFKLLTRPAFTIIARGNAECS